MSSSRSKSSQNSYQKPLKKSSASIKKKSLSTEGLSKINSKEPLKSTKSKTDQVLENDIKLLREIDLNKLEKGQLGDAFDKFWDAVTAGVDNNCDSLPRNTPIDSRILEIQKRIQLNQAVLQSTNERMKSINFQAERQNFSQWKDKINFMHYSKDDVNRLNDVNALDLELDKLRARKSDKSVFLKSSPGIANFHKTMETTLSMLDKIQNPNEFGDYKDVKKGFDLDVIKAPDSGDVSDEESLNN